MNEAPGRRRLDAIPSREAASFLVVQLRLACANVHSFQFELVGLGLTGLTREGLAAPCDVHMDEPGVLDGGDVLCFQQSAAYSSSPDFDILPCCRRDVFVDDNVSNLEPTARLEALDQKGATCSSVGSAQQYHGSFK